MRQSMRAALCTAWSCDFISSQSWWYSLVLQVCGIVMLLYGQRIAHPWVKRKRLCSLWSLHGSAAWWVSLLLLLATFAVLGGSHASGLADSGRTSFSSNKDSSR